MSDHAEQLAALSKFEHMLSHVYNLDADEYEGEDRDDGVTIDSANVVTSQIVGAGNRHSVVVDIDWPAKLIPSSTPGHFHLYIDRPMSWETYKTLLQALAGAGIVEAGFMQASIARGHTDLRLPWIKKGQA